MVDACVEWYYDKLALAGADDFRTCCHVGLLR